MSVVQSGDGGVAEPSIERSFTAGIGFDSLGSDVQTRKQSRAMAFATLSARSVTSLAHVWGY
jgi:hypothetical protein